MAEPFLGEIRMFAGNFAPEGWAFCNGQLFPIAEYTALFSLLGTQYGGNGTTDFALPDFQGRVPIHQGQDNLGDAYTVGEFGGTETVSVLTSQMPSHAHIRLASESTAVSRSPDGQVPGVSTRAVYGTTLPTPMATNTLGAAGGSQPHSNLQPFLCVAFIIALQGIYPSRS